MVTNTGSSDPGTCPERPSGTSAWHRLPAIIIILCMAAGGLLSVRALTSKPVEAWQTRSAWLSGAAERAVAAQLDEYWSSQPAAVLPRRVVDWMVLGDLGPQVRAGCSGWLFLTEEVAAHPEAEQSLQRRANMVLRVGRLLAQRGITLHVAVVPDKSRIESSHLCGFKRPARMEPRYRAFSETLAQGGLVTARLDAALLATQGERYFRSDSHWNELGAQAAAHAVSTHLMRTRYAPFTPTASTTWTHGPLTERVGDLIKLAGLAAAPKACRPQGDLVSESSAVVATAALDDLLGETAAPEVVVVGSSFSRTANFVESLSATLSTQVANVAKEGGGFAGAAMAYFGNDAFTQSPPRVVIWEFPERVLPMPLSKAELRWEHQLNEQGKL